MQYEKYINRVQFLNELIKKESTGPPRALANRLGISERMLYRYIQEVSEQHGEIVFCRIKNSYKFKGLP